LVFVYLLQKAYLRTSRQLRFLDLEAKSPLYTNMLDTYSGIVSIRAFGWQKQYQELNLNLLDMSQRPYYLLYLSQRWLNLVLDLMVAALAVLLVSFVVTIKDSPTGGSVGVGLLNILSLSQNLASLIRSWTLLETSLGAIARVKEVVDNTPNEDAGDLKQDPPAGWPGNGSICFRGVSATYKYVKSKSGLIISSLNDQ
jgi:ATP-binding cassette, subfamily C (CFTR/MRP), member 1